MGAGEKKELSGQESLDTSSIPYFRAFRYYHYSVSYIIIPAVKLFSVTQVLYDAILPDARILIYDRILYYCSVTDAELDEFITPGVLVIIGSHNHRPLYLAALSDDGAKANDRISYFSIQDQ